MKEKMTLHRALTELKLIDAKIQKKINELDIVGCYQQGKLVDGKYKKEDFEQQAKSSYQSIVDLIDRKVKIKSAVSNANAKTIVKVAGKDMTILDAINNKEIIKLKLELKESIKKESLKAFSFINVENEKIFNVALENSKIMLGKQGDDRVKPNDNDVKSIMEPFIERNKYLLSDILGCESLISSLTTEIEDFMLDIDSALSEINAVTIIEI